MACSSLRAASRSLSFCSISSMQALVLSWHATWLGSSAGVKAPPAHIIQYIINIYTFSSPQRQGTSSTPLFLQVQYESHQCSCYEASSNCASQPHALLDCEGGRCMHILSQHSTLLSHASLRHFCSVSRWCTGTVRCNVAHLLSALCGVQHYAAVLSYI